MQCLKSSIRCHVPERQVSVLQPKRSDAHKGGIFERHKNQARRIDAKQILGNKLPDWINHDIRRTVRTKFSALRIPEEVREAVLAHARPGIKGHYDITNTLTKSVMR